MKSLEEKKFLARMARNIGQPDIALEESIRREEEIANTLFVKKAQPDAPVLVVTENKEVTQPPVVTDNLVQRTAAAISEAPVQQKPPIPLDPRVKEIDFLKRQLTEVMNRINTLSIGGGGTGVVRFADLDDHQSPSDVRYLEFNTAGPLADPPDGSISWNPIEECMDVHQPDGTTLQVGLENYVRVYNDTANTFAQGTVVHFAGFYEPPDIFTEEHAPTIAKYVSNNSIPPLYVIGVLTEDIDPNNYGRATTFGKVRQLDTTGAAVGETWEDGDLLWAHPTIPGALTKVQPTAPNLAVSIAACIHAHNVNGQLLVRPAIFPSLHYGSFFDSTNQTAALANTAYAVKFNTTGIGCSHIRVSASNSANIICDNQGLYNFDFQLQVISTNSSRSNLWIWARRNGVDIPRSATKLSIESNGGTIGPSWAFRLPMNANDVFQLMWAVDSTNISLIAPAGTAFAPETPSATLQVTQVNL